MKSLRYTVLMSLIVLLLASCAALPPVVAPSAQAPAADQRAPVAANEQQPTAAPAAVEASPVVTATVAIAPTEPLTTTTTVPAAAVTPTNEQVMGANPLVGVLWEWAALLKTKPATQSVVPDPASYTLAFADDGSLSIKADCNSARATYTLADDKLTIKPGPATLIGCAPGSQGEAMLTALSKVGSYLIDAGDLILRLGDTGDSMLFRNGGPTAAPAAPPAAEVPAGAAAEMTPTPLPATTEAPAASAPAPNTETPQLIGTTWQWEQFVDVATGKTSMDVKDPQKYTVTFGADGSASMKADCNSAAGTYKLDGSKLTVEIGPVTLAACGAASLTDTFLINLTSAAGFKLENGKLNVDLMADGGRMVFGPAK